MDYVAQTDLFCLQHEYNLTVLRQVLLHLTRGVVMCPEIIPPPPPLNYSETILCSASISVSLLLGLGTNISFSFKFTSGSCH